MNGPTANFTWNELTRSATALRCGIDNEPPASSDVWANLRILAEKILQPVRDHFGRPVTVNSAYRCLELNRKLGSRDTSDHVRGLAADFEIAGIDNWEVAWWVRSRLRTRQVICEYMVDGDPDAGWIHASVGPFHDWPYLIIDKHSPYGRVWE